MSIKESIGGLVSNRPEQSQALQTREAVKIKKQDLAVDNKPRPQPQPPKRKTAFPSPGMNIIQKIGIGLGVFLTLLLGLIIGSAFLGGGVNFKNTMAFNPLLVIVGAAACLLIGVILGALVEMGVWKWKVPEAFLFAKIRFGTNILHRQIGLQGREVWRPARIDPDGQYLEVQFGDKWFPVSVNPGIIGGNKTSYQNGIMIVDTTSNNKMPMSVLDEVSLYQLEDYYKDPANGYKSLQFYHKSIIAFLYDCPPGDLDQHCASHISVDPSIITLPYLINHGYIQLQEVEVKDAEGNTVEKRPETAQELQGRIGERIKEIVNLAYSDLCRSEKDTLKAEVMRLKEETKEFYIQEGIFLRYACAEALDQRLATDVAETIQRIERNKQNRPAKQGFEVPTWIKGILVLFAGCAGIGLFAYILVLAVQKLTTGA